MFYTEIDWLALEPGKLLICHLDQSVVIQIDVRCVYSTSKI